MTKKEKLEVAGVVAGLIVNVCGFASLVFLAVMLARTTDAIKAVPPTARVEVQSNPKGASNDQR